MPRWAPARSAVCAVTLWGTVGAAAPPAGSQDPVPGGGGAGAVSSTADSSPSVPPAPVPPVDPPKGTDPDRMGPATASIDAPPPRTAAPPLPAPGRPRVLLWPEPGTPSLPAAERKLAAAIRDRVPGLVPSETVSGSPDVAARERADTEELRKMEAILNEARKAYLEFEFESARAKLEELLKSGLPVLTRGPELNLLAEARRLCGQVELAAGRGEAARQHAVAASFLLPEDAPRTGLPPEYARLELETRTEAARLAPRPLRLASQPPGADVLIDGRKRGQTPLTVDLLPGEHVVRVEMTGRLARATMVSVGEEGSAAELVLPPDTEQAVLLRRVARGQLDPGDPPTREVLASRVGVTHVVTYRAESARQDVLTLRVHPAGGPPVPVGSGDVGKAQTANRVADVVLGIRRPGGPLVIGEETDTPPPSVAPDRRFYTLWWFWATIGAAVALGGALAVSMLNQPEQTAILKPAPPPPPSER